MDQFRDERAEETRRNNNDDDDVEAVVAVAAVENAAPPADLPFHAAAAVNGDDEEEDVNLDPAEQEQICTEALTLLQKRLNLPLRLRDRTMVRFAQQFLNKVQEDAVVAAAVDTAAPAVAAHAAAAAGANEDEDENDDAVVAANNNDNDAAAAADEGEDEDDEDDVATLDLLDPAEREHICQEAMAILQNRLNLTSRLRDRTIVRFAKQFINNVKEDIHKMLTDTRIEDNGYDGLDSERDTEEEVATAIWCCPEVLIREDDRLGLHPIQCLTMMEGDNGKLVCNVRAVAFVPLFAQLAIEFHSFNETERGGLLSDSGAWQKNVLQDLVHSSDHIDDNHHQYADTTFLAVLIRLRQAGLLTIGDIQHYELVHHWCCHGWHRALGRFRFLTEWCPSSLITNITFSNGRLALHWTTCANGSIEVFRLYLDALFHFYPKWKGITALFQKDAFGTSSFEMACTKFTRNRVLDVVEEVLVRYTTTTPPVNIGDALMMAAIGTNISLDGVYFLMRRQPATMLSMLRHDTSIPNDTNDGMAGNTNHNNNNNNNAIVLRRSTRKRKRKRT